METDPVENEEILDLDGKYAEKAHDQALKQYLVYMGGAVSCGIMYNLRVCKMAYKVVRDGGVTAHMLEGGKQHDQHPLRSTKRARNAA